MPVNENSVRRSRRSFLQVSAAAATAIGFRVVTEPMLARADVHAFPKGAVAIDANENPLGPCTAARKAIAETVAQGGRYSLWMTEDLEKAFAAMEGLKPDYVHAFGGSGGPLH